MINAFISHVHEESAIARQVRLLLKECFAEQIEVFLAEDIQPGDEWWGEIHKALVNVDMIITIWSLSSLKSHWVHIETGYGIIGGKTVIPLCMSDLSGIDLPDPYKKHQALRINNLDQMQGLLAKIEGEYGGTLRVDRFKAVKKFVRKLATAMTKLNREIAIVDEHREREEFWAFFGGKSSPSLVAIFQDSYVDAFTIKIQRSFGMPDTLVTPSRAGDADQAAVYEDVQAAIAISRECSRMNAPFEARRDGFQFTGSQKTLVAIGLHNGATYKAQRSCPSGFFEVNTEGGLYTGQGTKIPNFTIEGTLYKQVSILRNQVDQSEALIVRTIDAASGLPMFVCGGHDGQGTAAAGVFLAEKWRDLLTLYRPRHDLQRDALAVVIKFNHSDPVNERKHIVKSVFARIAEPKSAAPAEL